MKKVFFLINVLILIVLASCTKTSDFNKAQWHHPLYMANNDYWRQRIAVDIQNNTGFVLAGAPVELPVGKGKGHVPVAGMPAEAVRAVNPDGIELTFRVTDKAGNIVERGPIPSDGYIVIPAECEKDASAIHYIYLDNPAAWPIGDFYKTHCNITNGSFETETVYGPAGWRLSLPDQNNRVELSEGTAHTGSKSILISIGQSGKKPLPSVEQRYIHLFSGAEYTVEGWVKGEHLQGEAKLSVDFADLNTEKFNLGTVETVTGSGTFDWKKVELKFTVPEKISGATVRLSVDGTGKAWFDDLQISCTQGYNVVAHVLKKEKRVLKDIGKTNDWFDDNTGNASPWQSRTAVSAVNMSPDDMIGKLLCVDAEEVINRLHAEINENSAIQVTNETKPISFYRAGDFLLFKQDIKAASVQTNYVYFNKASNMKSQVVNDLNEIIKNPVANHGFETGDLSGWQGDVNGTDTQISTQSKSGTKSVQLSLNGENTKETKIEQTLPVSAGTTYFFSAWMKSTDMHQQPDFTSRITRRILQAQFIAADGKNAGNLRRVTVYPDRYTDNSWSQLSMLIAAPPEATSVILQLVNRDPGTVWFDDIIFTEVEIATTSPLVIERLGAKDIKELTVWQEDPIVKVFPDDLPPSRPSGEISISLARNEVEPLQLVLRSPDEYKDVEIKVIPPVDASGNKLDAVDIGVVGFVPINHPSNYITDRTKTYWQQKIPAGRVGSDGWRGYWPDPILPFARFDLKANSSQPVWIEFRTPKNAVSGLYNGKVQLVNRGALLKEIPFSVRVRNFMLPDESHTVAFYDARVKTWDFYGSAKSEIERIHEMWQIFSEHRINPDAIKPEPVWTVENGEVVFDFTEFDKAADYYFNKLNFKKVYSPRYFYLFGWANLPQERFGEQPYEGVFPYEGVDRSKLRPEYIKRYQSALRNYWNHLKEKGWDDKFLLYISDEPHHETEITQQMHALCDMIHAVDPKILTYVSAWYYRPEYAGYVDVWGVSNHGDSWGRAVPVADLEKIRRIGKLWFTTDGKMCTDTPYLGFERLLPHYNFKYGAEAYEFWGSNWYTFNPYEYGWHAYIRQSDRPGDLYWIRYPNGDANFIYPGLPIGVEGNVPTIRLKLAREGVEDYEYLYMLDNLIKEAKKQGKNVSDAEEALSGALDIITIPSSEGRYSTEYLPDPYVVMKVRNQVGDAIEKLIK